MTAFVAVIAAVLGGWAFVSVPAETGPSPLLWLLPAVAIISATVPAVGVRRLPVLVGDALVAVAAGELVLWAW